MQKAGVAYLVWGITVVWSVLLAIRINASPSEVFIVPAVFVCSFLIFLSGACLGILFYRGEPIKDGSLEEDRLLWVDQILEHGMLIVTDKSDREDLLLIKISDDQVFKKIRTIYKEKGVAYIARQRFTKGGEVCWAIAESGDERIARTSKGYGRIMHMLG